MSRQSRLRRERKEIRAAATLRARRDLEPGVRALIKCRLWHSQGLSIIVPDQIYTGMDQLQWYQTRTFSPPIPERDATDLRVTISVKSGQRTSVAQVL